VKKGLKGIMAVLFAAAVIATPRLCSAQDDVYDLGEIVISGVKAVAPAVASVVEVTSADIEAIGAKSVAEALSYTAGVRVSVGLKDEADVKLRGFKQSKLLVLMDGVPVSSPFYGYLDLNQIPTDNISKIVVTKGLSSVLYGSDAMAGVVNIITKKQSGKPAGKIKFEAGDNDESKTSVSYSMPKGKMYYSVGGGYSESDGFNLSDKFVPVPDPGNSNKIYEDGGQRLNADYERTDFFAKVGLDGSKDKYFVNFNYVDNPKGMPVPIKPSDATKYTKFSRYSAWKSWTMSLDGDKQFSPKFSVKGNVYYHKFDNTLDIYKDETFTTLEANTARTPTGAGSLGTENGAKLSSTYDDYTAGMRLISSYKVSKGHQLNASVNVTQDNHKNQSATDYPWEKYVSRTTSLALESNVTLSERFSFVVGASYDKLDQRSALTYTDTYKIGSTKYYYPTYASNPAVWEATAKTTTGEDKSALNPQIGISIKPDAETTLHASWGRKTRFPTLNELYSYSKGNVNLEPQINNMYEFGFERAAAPGLTVSGTFFNNKITNLITSHCLGSTCQNINVDKSIYRGFEFGAEQVYKRLTARADATLMSPRDLSYNIFADYVPRRKVDYSLSYSIGAPLTAAVTATTVSPRYYYNMNSTAYLALPSYSVINVSLSGDIKALDAKWRLFADNVMDKDYQEEVNFPQEGRTYRGEIEYNF